MNPPGNGTVIKPGLATYVACYNQKRRYSNPDDKTPDEGYFKTMTQQQAA